MSVDPSVTLSGVFSKSSKSSNFHLRGGAQRTESTHTRGVHVDKDDLDADHSDQGNTFGFASKETSHTLHGHPRGVQRGQG